MSQGVKVRVWGERALFTRPEMKTERCTYDVMTPSAARGILESIYWHPGMRWVIDRIVVRKPIEFTSIRRNEVTQIISASSVLAVMNGADKPLYISSKENIAQRASILLTNVDYVIEAHFEMTQQAHEGDNPGKFKDIMMRRLRRGECYSMPYFGCREFPAHFELFEGEAVSDVYAGTEKELGCMLYDMDFSDPKEIVPMFFRACLKDGILDVRDCEVVR